MYIYTGQILRNWLKAGEPNFYRVGRKLEVWERLMIKPEIG